MKNYFHVLVQVIFVILLTAPVSAQYAEKGWLIGGGFNFIDDSGTNGSQPFNFTDNWSSVAFPSRFSMGYQLDNGMFFQGFASYNKYNQDVIVDGTPQEQAWNYYALDGMFGYGFQSLIDPRGWFDPFLQTGMGLNRLAGNNELTFNLGGGFNFWINDRFAINLSTLGKWELDKDRRDNHIQHGIGVVFKPDFKKLFAKNDGVDDGESTAQNDEEQNSNDLLASTEQVTIAPSPEQKEREQRVKDSIARAMEAQRSIEQKAEIITRRLQNDLATVQRVSFAVNSSYFQPEDYSKLDELVAFMNYYPSAVIEIRGNADPRGTEEYNAWLSLRRSSRIKKYLTDNGIAYERVISVGAEKEKANGPCSDGKPCTEEELSESRKVEYVLLDY